MNRGSVITRRPRYRFLVAAIFGLTAAAISARAQVRLHAGGGDFFVMWRAAQVLVQGANPYEILRPGLAWDWNAYWYYPLPAALLGAPFLWLSPALAAVLFVSLSSALLGYAFAMHGRPWFPLLISVPFWICAQLSQVSAAIMAFGMLPPTAGLVVIKPSLGMALWAWRPSWRTVLVGMTLCLAGLVVLPDWPIGWLQAASHSTTHRPLVFRPFGFVGLLAALRWRRPEGRLLVAMTIMPSALWFYDELLIFLVPNSAIEAIVLCAGSWVAWIGAMFAAANVPGRGVLPQAQPWIALAMFIPATIMVLRRPNEGNGFTWIDKVAPRISKAFSRSASRLPSAQGVGTERTRSHDTR